MFFYFSLILLSNGLWLDFINDLLFKFVLFGWLIPDLVFYYIILTYYEVFLNDLRGDAAYEKTVFVFFVFVDFNTFISSF